MVRQPLGSFSPMPSIPLPSSSMNRSRWKCNFTRLTRSKFVIFIYKNTTLLSIQEFFDVLNSFFAQMFQPSHSPTMKGLQSKTKERLTPKLAQRINLVILTF